MYLFDDYSVDTQRRELRRGTESIPVEPQVFDLLVFLIDNRDRVVTRDALQETVWRGRTVSDSTFNSRINSVRRAIGDSGSEQRLVRTIARKGYRFVGTLSDAAGPPPVAPEPLDRNHPQLRQEIRFCSAADGARIAYASVGQGFPVVKAGNWLNHLEYDWQSPVWSHVLRAVAARHRLIRYDARGNGLSDWDVADISLEAFTRDLEAVVDAAGLERFALFGISQGCAVCIEYAQRYPERVSHLVLYGGYARGLRRRGNPADIEFSDALRTVMLAGWGKDNAALRQMFTSLFIPGGTAQQMQWFNDLQRLTTSAQNAVRIRRANEEIDVTASLARVTSPTLVMHCRHDEVVPYQEGRRIAVGIPGARFVELDGRNHLILEDDEEWPRFRSELETFLGAT